MRRTVFVLIAVLVLAGFLAAGWLSRQAWPGAGVRTAEIRDASPLVVFTTVALGGVRGLIADLLWLRVSALQESGRYFEVVQLADWITKLEPDSSEVWAFHAWNMAYNISIMFPDAPDRWRWIQNGLRLLRHEGLNYNPGDPRLYVELAMIYQHKIGGTLDEYHPAYLWYYAGAVRVEAAKGIPPCPEEMRTETRAWREFNQRYNPDGSINWRAPEAMAAYWAWRGMRIDKSFHARQCARLFAHCAIDLYRRGRVVYSTDPVTYLRLPDLAIREGMRRALTDAGRLFNDEIVNSIGKAYDDEEQLYAFVFDKRKPAAPANPDAARAVERALFRRLQAGPRDKVERLVVDILALAHGADAAGLSDEAGGLTRLAEIYCAQVRQDVVDITAWQRSLNERAVAQYVADARQLNRIARANNE